MFMAISYGIINMRMFTCTGRTAQGGLARLQMLPTTPHPAPFLTNTLTPPVDW